MSKSLLTLLSCICLSHYHSFSPCVDVKVRHLSSVALNLFSHLSLPLTYSPSPHPRVTPCPNSSMQNRAGRSCLSDQNALFSEFSPFTRGEREAASPGPPRPAVTRTQHQPDKRACTVSQRHREVHRDKTGSKNKQQVDNKYQIFTCE